MLYIFHASCCLHTSWKIENFKHNGIGETNFKRDQHHLQSVQDCVVGLRQMEVLKCPRVSSHVVVKMHNACMLFCLWRFCKTVFLWKWCQCNHFYWILYGAHDKPYIPTQWKWPSCCSKVLCTFLCPELRLRIKFACSPVHQQVVSVCGT